MGSLGPFAHRAFAVYWAGGLFSNIGSWLQAIAASVYVYDRTGSALAVGVLNFATWLPMLLFSVWGGVISDRHDRRKIVVVTQAASAALTAVLAVLVAAGLATELVVIAIAFTLQTSWTIAKPSSTAMIPALVPRSELTDAVGLNTLQFMAAQLIGPVIATLVLATSGPALAFAVNAVTFTGPILSMLYLYRARLAGRATPSAARTTAEAAGLRAYMRSEGWIAPALVAVICTSSVLEVVRTLAPVIATSLGQPSSAAGLVVAAQSVGYVVGILAFIRFRRGELGRRVAVGGLALQGAGLVALSAAPSFPLAAVGVASIGLGFSLCFPVVTGALQSEVPDAIRGRLMALHQMAHLGNRPFAALAAGAAAATLGVPAAALAALVVPPVGVAAVRIAWRGLASRAEPDPAIAAG